MSNNGPRFQARVPRGFANPSVLDSEQLNAFGDHRTVCICGNPEEAIGIATALNRMAMQMADDQGNGDGY